MSQISSLLESVKQGEKDAANKLFLIVYNELRQLAESQLAHEKPGQTLQATALVHEVYLKLLGHQSHRRFEGQSHFFAVAAEAIRRILVDQARKKLRLKRGGDRQRIELQDPVMPCQDDQLLLLDEGLQRLAVEDPISARVVELHHFGGLPHDTVAELLNLTVYRARQKWAYACAWLSDYIQAQ